jgi:CheY-like chemotaxis protein
LNPVTVVVVDDIEDIRFWFRVLLETGGLCTVVAEATNGLEAIEAAKQHQPDVVVLDLAMPEMGGIEALPLIKEASPNTAVVAVTAYGTMAEQEAYDAGAFAFVTKGAKPGQLVDAVHNAAGRPAPG